MSPDLISALTAAAERIEGAVNDWTGKELRNRINVWCDQHGLTQADNPSELLARHAAFCTLLLATLGEAKYRRGEVPAPPADPQTVLREASVIDPLIGDSLLTDVARLVPPDGLADVVDARQQVIAADSPAEVIGRLFEQVTPQDARRRLGQFRTPTHVAAVMGSWISQQGGDHLLDPGIGAGALSAAASRHSQTRADTSGFEHILGIDVTPLACLMGATTLTLCNPSLNHSLTARDFLDLTASDIDGAIDGIICNPPYTRHQELSEEYKHRANTQAEETLGRQVSGRSPLYAYWLYRAAPLLAPGACATYLTPAEFLETGYGESLKRYLLDEFRIEALVLLDRNSGSIFDEAMTTSLVSFLRKPDESGDTGGSVRFIRASDWPGNDEILAAVRDGKAGETDWGVTNDVRQDALRAEENWTIYFDPCTASAPTSLSTNASFTRPLSEIATVRRGILTGQNSFFCLTQAEVEEWGLDEEYLTPLVRSSRNIPGYEYGLTDWETQLEDGKEAWLLYHLEDVPAQAIRPSPTEPSESVAIPDGSGIEIQHMSVIPYLRHGMDDEVQAHAGYVARNRDPWFLVDRRAPAPILASYMSSTGFRAVRNTTDARHLNNLLGVYPDVNMSEAELKALLAYLNCGVAERHLRRQSRTYSDGMEKFEPGDVESIPVVDPRSLRDSDARRLAAGFDELRAAVGTEEQGEGAVKENITSLVQDLM